MKSLIILKRLSYLLILIMLLSCTCIFDDIPCGDLIASAASGDNASSSIGGSSGGGGTAVAYRIAINAFGRLDTANKKINVDILLNDTLDNASVGYAALYKNDSLLETKTFDLNTRSSAVDFDFDGTIEAYNQAYTIKLFALSSSLKPMTKCKTVEITDDNDSTVTMISSDIEKDKCTENQLWFYDHNDAPVYVTLSSECCASYNGAPYTDIENTSVLLDLVIPTDTELIDSDVIITLKDIDHDRKFDCINAWNMYYDMVDTVIKRDDGSYRIIIGTGKIDVDYTAAMVDIKDADGKTIAPDELSEGDVIAYCTDAEDNALRDFTYAGIVQIGDSIEGTVTAINKNFRECTIKGVTYEYSADLDGMFYPEDSAKFYVGLSGKLCYVKLPPPEYAYILEFAESQSSFDDYYEVRLLTAHDGVKIYKFTAAADNKFYQYSISELGVSNSRQLFSDIYGTSEMGNSARFIKFKTNSDGLIKSFEKADGALSYIDASEYKAATNKIGNKFFSDDAIIYYVNDRDIDCLFTTSIDELVDGFRYSGYAFKDSNGEYTAFIVTEYTPIPSDDTGFAVVTNISETIYDGYDAISISYYRDESEDTIIFTDDSAVLPNCENVFFEALAIGDVIDIVESRNGVVISYTVLGKIDKNGIVHPYEKSLDAYSDANGFVFGYISNNTKKAVSKGELIEVKTSANTKKEFAVLAYTNKYTYRKGTARKCIYAGDMWDGDTTDYFDDVNNTATPVFVRIVDGDVVDVYTFDTRVDIADDGTASVNGEQLELFSNLPAESGFAVVTDKSIT